MKNYNKAPLPFQGQKRNFVKKFRESLKEFPEDAIYVDLFGGSGLLSHNVKSVHPNATVIYNDFDGYSKRLKYIDKTNLLIIKIKGIIKDSPFEKRIVEPIRLQILDLIKKEDGFVDYITLSGNLLFSGSYAKSFEDLKNQTFYNRLTSSQYNADDFLKNVYTVCEDYKDLFSKYEAQKNIVFLLDPPYLSTDVKSYTNENYWKLTDYLDVLKTIEEKSFFYFTSDKSQIVELLKWLSDNNYGYNPFKNATTTTTTTTTTINHSSKYEDIMIYKNAI